MGVRQARRPSPSAPMPLQRPALLGLAVLLLGFSACNAAPDKRTLQYLNRYGFGKQYYGNAEEENYATIGDTVVFHDQLHPDELSGNQKVDIDGTILVPEVGTVHVAGFTRSDIEAILKERYSVFYDETDIVVQIRTKGKKYFVFGEVSREGEQKHPGDLTIFEAVMKARPDPRSANLGRVRLMRPDPIDPLIITVNINDMLDNADSTYNVHVQEYDIVYVPATLLAEFAYFLEDLLFPVTQLLRSVGGAIFGYGGRNVNRRGRVNNNYGGNPYF